MKRLRNIATATLVVGNILLFGVLVGADQAAASGVDSCEEGNPDVANCDCLDEDASTWLPGGCYNVEASVGFVCTTGADCEMSPE